MNNIYDIRYSLEDLFQTIEENEGVITEEQLELLNIKQEELKDKLEAYVKVVQVYKNNTEGCKSEEKRIKERRNVYDNRINKLKEIILDTVEKFGTKTKTNKVIELPTFRLSTRNVSSLNINEDRVHSIVCMLEEYLTDLVNKGIFTNCTNLQEFVDILNKAIAESMSIHHNDLKEITIDDLKLIKVNINTTKTLADLLTNGEELINYFGKNYNTFMDKVIDKTFIKSELPFAPNNTIAKVENKNTLIIK